MDRIVSTTFVNYDWLLDEPLFATAIESPDSDRRVVVTDAGRRWAAVIKAEEMNTGVIVSINGEWIDLADDLPVLIGLIDLVYEMGTGQEHYLEPVAD